MFKITLHHKISNIIYRYCKYTLYLRSYIVLKQSLESFSYISRLKYTFQNVSWIDVFDNRYFLQMQNEILEIKVSFYIFFLSQIRKDCFSKQSKLNKN